ncbi:DUF3515 family protein [Cellulomonas sp. NPDC089187]|uniref:DUF3515 family protein n=1 Tax=Cellulomonas sp. NPDC089187 TaxID=3154970 RepID=UPI00341C4512
MSLRRTVAFGGVVLILSGCAQTVGVPAAEYAQDPECARVILALPDSLGDGLDRLDTTSQATAAWGTPDQAVVLRCGVEPPGPTTEQCVTMETASGATVDWLVRAESLPADGTSPSPTATLDPASDPGGSDWTFLSYGRDPAIEVQVPAAVVGDRSTTFLDALVPAVSQVPADRSCV